MSYTEGEVNSKLSVSATLLSLTSIEIIDGFGVCAL